MKKIIFYFAIIVAILATEKTWAQARVTNTTPRAITIKSTDGNGEVMIKGYEKSKVSFAPSFGAFAFDLYVYEGTSERYIASFTKNVKQGQFTISNKDLTGENPENDALTLTHDAPAPLVKDVPEYQEPAPKSIRTTNAVIKNSSDFRVVALDGIFAGLALAPGQESTDSVAVPTGQFEATFKHDTQQESSTNTTPAVVNTRNTRNDAKIAHGRSYRQSVYSGIVVQGQKVLEIKNENLTFIEGKTIRTMAKSAIPYKIVFTAGPWKGQALNNFEYSAKAEVSEGFNSFSIQYVGTDGLKYQADIEVIVTPRDRPLVFKENDIKNKMRIKQ